MSTTSASDRPDGNLAASNEPSPITASPEAQSNPRKPTTSGRETKTRPKEPHRTGLQDGWHVGSTGRVLLFWSLILAVVLLLVVVRGIVAPFIWALILAYLLNPIVRLACRYLRLPRIIAVAGIYLALGSAIVWLWLTTAPFFLGQVREFGDSLPRLVDQLVVLLDSADSIVFFGWEVDVEPLVAEIVPTINATMALATHFLLETAVEVIEVALQLTLMLVATFYLLVDLDRLVDFWRRQIPRRFRTELGPLVNRIDQIVVRFIYGELLLVVIMSTVTYVALTILGVRFALVLAIATGFLELIPYVGPITAGCLAVMVTLGQPSPFGWPPVIYGGVVAGVYFVLRHAEDYFVIPNVIGRVVRLHPVLTMFSIFCGAILGGIMGMLLAVPVAAILRLIAGYMWRKIVEAESF